MTATRMLYAAAGSPPVAAQDATGPCWLCGLPLPDAGVPTKDAIKPTFMDHDKARCPASRHLCPGCAWSFSEAVPMAGRDKPQRLRNYSHIVQNGVWQCLSKAQKAEMRAALCQPPAGPWLGVIAVSGQKHIIFRAPVAEGRDNAVIQVEEARVAYAPDDLAALATAVTTLLNLDFSKAEIADGHYLTHRIARAGLAVWREHEERIRPRRGTALLDLAVFLAQKETTNDRDIDRPATDGCRPHVHSAPLHQLGHVGAATTEVLGHHGDDDGERGASDEQPVALAQLRLLPDVH